MNQKYGEVNSATLYTYFKKYAWELFYKQFTHIQHLLQRYIY